MIKKKMRFCQLEHYNNSMVHERVEVFGCPVLIKIRKAQTVKKMFIDTILSQSIFG
jgi:hypothetical protein